MGDLYLFDHDGGVLHPRDGDPSGVPRGFDLENVVLRLDVDSTWATLRCLVNGVETNEDRTQAIATFRAEETSGVFGECIDAVETELLKRRGWTITPVENQRNPGYAFQRIRNAASGKNPNPKHVPMDHEVIQSVLEDGTTVTFHVRDYSVAGDLILRYGNVGCPITVARSFALSEDPSGLVIVQDDSVDRAMELSPEARERVREKKLQNYRGTIADGVGGLTSLGVSGEDAAEMIGRAVGRHYEDVDVLGPQEGREVSKLARNVRTLKGKNERLREQLKELETENRRLERRIEAGETETETDGTSNVGSDRADESPEETEPDADPDSSTVETDAADDGILNRKVGMAILVGIAIVLLTLLSLAP